MKLIPFSYQQEDADAITQILSGMHADQWPGHLAV
jgi:hypothetical protein